MLFPLAVHCLDLFASTVGMHFVQTTPGIPLDVDIKYNRFEEPVVVMKKGYRVAMAIGITGFVFICY